VVFVTYRDVSAAQYAYGCVIEPTKVPGTTVVDADTDLDSLTDFPVAVARGGLLNRDMIEDNLGRALTVFELAAIAHPECNLRLTAT
jgi:hypothetical protein